MAKARKTLNRLSAIKSIHAVTVAMETVASSQFKKTYNHAVAVRPYTDKLVGIVGDVIRRCTVDHPLVHSTCEVSREVLVVLTSSRGLCGGFNSAVLHLAMERFGQLIANDSEVLIHAAGRKGISFLTYRDIKIDREYSQLSSPPSWREITVIADELMGEFLAGRISGLEVAYTQFVSPSRQQAAIAQILPVSDIDPSVHEDPRDDDEDENSDEQELELIPSADDLVSHLLPAMVRLKLYQCFLDSAVSEHVARIFAMRGANENADEMIRTLTRRYNRLRQGQITTELIEILGGRMESN